MRGHTPSLVFACPASRVQSPAESHSERVQERLHERSFQLGEGPASYGKGHSAQLRLALRPAIFMLLCSRTPWFTFDVLVT